MKHLTLTLLMLMLAALTITAQEKITIVAKPRNILIEQGENSQHLNFDFLVSNNSTDTFKLIKLTVTVLDKTNHLIYTRFLDNNGTAPSISLIPHRDFNGASSFLIFNPFYDFSLSMPLFKLVYEFTFAGVNDEEMKISTSIHPKKYSQKLNYKFPLSGKILNYDGHDLYAHHRRFDYEFAPIKSLGISSNFMRYAYDFVVLGNDNKQFKNEGKNDEDYFGFGKPVYSIGDGKVIYASNTHKDDKQFNIPEIANNPLELYGNCIAILHADSSVSVYGHLKQNSLKVKAGDAVRSQQLIGAIGVSGSSFFPHLHFEMRTSIKSSADGMPSYFSNIYAIKSGMTSKINSGLVETGNIILTQ